MRRYPVQRLPENPPAVSFRNYTLKQPKPMLKEFCQSSAGTRQNCSVNTLINKGQLFLVIVGIFFGIISSEAGGKIISFSSALIIMFILAGAWSFLVFWRLARFVGIGAWVSSAMLSWFFYNTAEFGLD